MSFLPEQQIVQDYKLIKSSAIAEEQSRGKWFIHTEEKPAIHDNTKITFQILTGN